MIIFLEQLFEENIKYQKIIIIERYEDTINDEDICKIIIIINEKEKGNIIEDYNSNCEKENILEDFEELKSNNSIYR